MPVNTDSSSLHPQNMEETVIWYAMTGMWVVYVFGGLYLVAPVIGWLLLVWAVLKPYMTTPLHLSLPKRQFMAGPWIWGVGMAVMLLALFIGHINFDLGFLKLVKSSFGWAKGWALLAIFIIIGASLHIRPRILYRAACILGLQTLVLIPVFVGAAFAGLPEQLYVSPLKYLGGAGPEYFTVRLYSVSYDGSFRWQFWAPWAPAAGFAANILFILALREKNRWWRAAGVSAAILMCLMSFSRLALVALLVVGLATFFLSRATRPKLLLWLGAPAVLLAGLFLPQIMNTAYQARETFDNARADSSRVRATLNQIALERWQNEAPVFGHGIVEKGPQLVEHMAIGSHHSWFGLLFVKGIVGFFALLIPFLWTFSELLVKAQGSETAQVGLAVTLTLLLYTFGENLEVLVYLFWPGLIMIGIAFGEKLRNPFVAVPGDRP